MDRYRAKPGQEDRHGEMTGAITVNMIVSMIPIGVWCFFIGPLFGNVWLTAGVALALALALPVALLPVSRIFWAWMSDRADRI